MGLRQLNGFFETQWLLQLVLFAPLSFLAAAAPSGQASELAIGVAVLLVTGVLVLLPATCWESHRPPDGARNSRTFRASLLRGSPFLFSLT